MPCYATARPPTDYMLVPLLWFGLGLTLLILGADWFLRGASGVALRYGISPFVVGLLIIGFGTSSPELAVNVSAVWRGSYDLALGNVVGSNIANIGLIVGLSALIAPLAVHMRLLRVEAPLMILTGALLWVLCLDGRLGRGDALLLLLGFVGLLVYVARTARMESQEVQSEFGDLAQTRPGLKRNLAKLVVGLAVLLLGADLMVDSAVTLARLWGWSELLIGLTVVAIGTSLPELASSLLAARRGQTDIAVGNVVGSCLFNILLILGVTASIHPLPVASTLLWVQLPVMVVFSAALYPILCRGLNVQRSEGALLLLAFVGFTSWQVWSA
jgi:cation:H+ antiporter